MRDGAHTLIIVDATYYSMMLLTMEIKPTLHHRHLLMTHSVNHGMDHILCQPFAHVMQGPSMYATCHGVLGPEE